MAEEEYSEDQESGDDLPVNKKNNTLPLWGNKETMNINSLILKNIKSSPYFKQDLYRLKTYHEVVDEIYYKVGHLEPWEKNSRKLASQIGHAGEVRGVSAGGIVSTPYCLLYKLFTLKLTRKQLKGLLDHADSPYIRGLGFMYIRYCQPPADLIEWYEPYFWDEEVIDLKAGGGFQTTIGEMCKMLLTKLDWFGTLFPRIPVVVENQVKKKMKQLKEEEEEYGEDYGTEANNKSSLQDFSGKLSDGEKYKGSESRERLTHSRSGDKRMSRSRSKDRRSRSRSKDRRRNRSRSKDRRRSRSRSKDRRRSRSRSKDRRRSRSRSKDRRRSRSRSKDRRRNRSRSKDRRRSRSRSKDRRRSRSRSKDRRRSRSRSKDRRRSRSRSKDGRHTSSSYHRHSPASQQGGGRSSERKRQRSPDKRTKDRSRSSERHRHRSSSRERTRYRSSRERSRSRSRDRYKGSKY